MDAAATCRRRRLPETVTANPRSGGAPSPHGFGKNRSRKSKRCRSIGQGPAPSSSNPGPRLAVGDRRRRGKIEPGPPTKEPPDLQLALHPKTKASYIHRPPEPRKNEDQTPVQALHAGSTTSTVSPPASEWSTNRARKRSRGRYS